MGYAKSDWEDQLARWLKPFPDCLGHEARRRTCPRYIAGLIGLGGRKSVQPMAERFAAVDYDQLHHFIVDGVWDATPLETELFNEADRLVGGEDAVLVIDDTALKTGRCCGSISLGACQNGELTNIGVADARA